MGILLLEQQTRITTQYCLRSTRQQPVKYHPSNHQSIHARTHARKHTPNPTARQSVSQSVSLPVITRTSRILRPTHHNPRRGAPAHGTRRTLAQNWSAWSSCRDQRQIGRGEGFPTPVGRGPNEVEVKTDKAEREIEKEKERQRQRQREKTSEIPSIERTQQKMPLVVSSDVRAFLCDAKKDLPLNLRLRVAALALGGPTAPPQPAATETSPRRCQRP